MKIRGEQDELAAEKADLEKTLGSARRLKTLVRKELEADTDAFGDERRTDIVDRPAAVALSEADLVSAEPVTVLLSLHGFVRAAKGHDIDPTALSYRSGDEFQAAARGKSNQTAAFIDSQGRVYNAPAHALPSARGQGEPLAGRFNPADGAAFRGVMLGDSEARWVVASSAGYGFVVAAEHLLTRAKAGKALLRVPAGADVVPPAATQWLEGEMLAAATSTGRLLVFDLDDLPELPRGKGNKILGIPTAKFASGEERLVSVCAIAPDAALRVHCGERVMTLKAAQLEEYIGERGRRGRLLSRNYRQVTRLSSGDEPS